MEVADTAPSRLTNYRSHYASVYEWSSVGGSAVVLGIAATSVSGTSVTAAARTREPETVLADVAGAAADNTKNYVDVGST